MRTRLVLVVCLILAATGKAQTSERTDAETTTALLGTWEAPENRISDKIVSESTYMENGIVNGFTTVQPQFRDESNRESKIKMHAHWRIDHGTLLIDCYETEPPGIFSQDYVAKYEIVSLTHDEVVFRAIGNGQELYRRRKKN